MKKTLLAAFAMPLTTMCLTAAWADGHESEEPNIYPVEAYTCKYNDGKGPADLDKVIAAWNEWMDEEDADNYFAMTLTPHYFGGETFDVGWLGSARTATELGVGADNWRANGGEHAAAFASVLTCDSHSNFATMQVKQPPERTSPDSLVISFADCSAAEGKTMDDVFTAMDAWTAYTTEQGYTNGAWVMFPAFGVNDADFDFKLVNAYDNHADMGKGYDMYANGGGYQKHVELMDGVMVCDVARVYDGTVRRRIAEED